MSHLKSHIEPLEYIVYPPHGVGQIQAIEEQEVAGYNLKLYVIHFVRDKMYVKVPVAKASELGLRRLSDKKHIEQAMDVLYSKAKVKRTMWSRRAQEYETKINSGDIVSIAEVVRDLFKIDSHLTQSYSERQLYETALDRLCREVSLVQGKDLDGVIKQVESYLEEIRLTKSKSVMQPTIDSEGSVAVAS